MAASAVGPRAEDEWEEGGATAAAGAAEAAGAAGAAMPVRSASRAEAPVGGLEGCWV